MGDGHPDHRVAGAIHAAEMQHFEDSDGPIQEELDRAREVSWRCQRTRSRALPRVRRCVGESRPARGGRHPTVWCSRAVRARPRPQVSRGGQVGVHDWLPGDEAVDARSLVRLQVEELEHDSDRLGAADPRCMPGQVVEEFDRVEFVDECGGPFHEHGGELV